MKHWTFRILLCLFLGVVTTVTIAWCAACVSWYWPSSTYEFSTTETDKVRTQFSEFDQVMKSGTIVMNTYKWVGLTMEMAVVNVGLDKECYIERRRSGWPFRSMSGYWILDSNRQQQVWRLWDITEGPMHTRTMIPMSPIWSGFLINTLFYGTIWFGTMYLFTALKQGRRRRKGRCPKCAYDLRADLNSGCPECGWKREEVK